MEARLSQSLLREPAAREAERLLRTCVHCGFCLPACPTYELSGDELDSPRGRIYLIKEVLEGRGGKIARQHLDRCLLCRACERACPSGVEYSRLAAVTRRLVAAASPRNLKDWLLRRLIGAVVPYPSRLSRAVAVARLLRPLLPAPFAATLPARPAATGFPRRSLPHPRRILLVPGCAQSVFSPATHLALARVCHRLGIEPVFSPGSGCCGALSHHLGFEKRALGQIRRNLDLWWPELQAGAEGLMIPASACALMVREYPAILASDGQYAERARRIADVVKDPAELLLSEGGRHPFLPPKKAVAFHCPCTQRPGTVEALLQKLGVPLIPQQRSPACCGAAGAYALLQPKISSRLLDWKVSALEEGGPTEILTANIGCQLHLAGRSRVPVRHWVELIDECQAAGLRLETPAGNRTQHSGDSSAERFPPFP
ncbi:glycolate oxidase subunit GlcF [Methylacidimicrobium sp. AP8]|uniref:glycolate oxidase subunit GlcF n=1 Tax=Methylacidimicrobium sp. AP8 TaxID=2730359 RepID=UPI001920D34B|nr:glycolate oxidase subunit GlcF [Methylacidimicrobium sp. AP8]